MEEGQVGLADCPWFAWVWPRGVCRAERRLGGTEKCGCPGLGKPAHWAGLGQLLPRPCRAVLRTGRTHASSPAPGPRPRPCSHFSLSPSREAPWLLYLPEPKSVDPRGAPNRGDPDPNASPPATSRVGLRRLSPRLGASFPSVADRTAINPQRPGRDAVSTRKAFPPSLPRDVGFWTCPPPVSEAARDVT